ncbi:MAG: NVEALA domain-containing protein [Prevotellaceae bacterium]|jgi:hypothetical protein|nr:NVEALA domain-containing protein [Prevotellaceae bacterium]
MKKKILGGIAVLAIAAVAMMNVNFNSQSNELSAISLANVEALAEESSGCHYTNGYTAFSGKFGGAYDCCQIWRNTKPADNATMCQ